MIQRIQSLWLVLAACCIALSLMAPIAEYRCTIPTTGQHVEADLKLFPESHPEMYDQLASMSDTVVFHQPAAQLATWPMILLAFVAIAIAVVSIFLYRNRKVQVRVVAIGFLLTAIYDLLLLFWIVDAYSKRMLDFVQGEALHTTWFAGIYAPIVAIVFFMLARRGIRKDEALVRSADRLR